MKRCSLYSVINSVFAFLFLMVFSGYAAAGGGLDAATTWLTDFKTWFFGFVCLAALVYLLYCVIMALAEKKAWADVGMALVYCALAGGAIVGGTWAISMFQ